MKARLILVLLGMTIPCELWAENPKDTVEIRAIGEVIVPSDTVALRITVSTGHSDIHEAKNRNDRIAKQIFDLADSQHLRRPTLSNTSMSFDLEQRPGISGGGGKIGDANLGNANYRKSGKGGGKGEPSGEEEAKEPSIQMSRQVDAVFKDLNQAIGFVAEVAKWEPPRKGELRLSPLSFVVADPHPHFLEARRRAVASAIEKAKLLADLNGLRLANATLIFDESPETVGMHGGPARPADDDPFAVPALPGVRTAYVSSSPSPISVATQVEPKEKANLDRIPPAQIVISASVRIVFDMHKPEK